jgi:hypothetical protein
VPLPKEPAAPGDSLPSRSLPLSHTKPDPPLSPGRTRTPLRPARTRGRVASQHAPAPPSLPPFGSSPSSCHRWSCPRSPARADTAHAPLRPRLPHQARPHSRASPGRPPGDAQLPRPKHVLVVTVCDMMLMYLFLQKQHICSSETTNSPYTHWVPPREINKEKHV